MDEGKNIIGIIIFAIIVFLAMAFGSSPMDTDEPRFLDDRGFVE